MTINAPSAQFDRPRVDGFSALDIAVAEALEAFGSAARHTANALIELRQMFADASRLSLIIWRCRQKARWGRKWRRHTANNHMPWSKR